jgi:hypothetical protein
LYRKKFGEGKFAGIWKKGNVKKNVKLSLKSLSYNVQHDWTEKTVHKIAQDTDIFELSRKFDTIQ